MSLLDKASLVQIPSGYGDGKLYSVKPTPTYGSELITNGDFATDSDWNKGANWTISGGKAVGINTFTSLSQSISLLAQSTYKITFTILDYVSGDIKMQFTGGTTVNSDIYNSNGTYIVYLVALSGNNTFNIKGQFGAEFNGSIDNVSVKEVTNSGDFDFSRSSSGTRVNSEGLIETAQIIGSEEVTNGDFSNGSTDWNLPSGVTYNSNGYLDCNSVSSNINQTTSIASGKTYKVSFEIKNYISGTSVRIRINGGAFNTVNINGNGVYTSIITADQSSVFRFYPSSLNGSLDNVSVKEVIENDIPRLDYSDGSCASLLLEPQTQNLVTYSENFSQWNTLSANAATYISDLVNPDGSVGGYKVSGSGIYLGISLLTTTQRSIYARSVSGSGDVQLFTHNSNTNNVFTLTEEWQRFDVNSTTSSTAVGNYYIDLRGSSSTLSEFYVWGAQATNDQSYVTSYIPSNSGSSTTRTADVCDNAGTSATFNDAEGVLFAEIAALANDGTNRTISISDGTNTNQIVLRFSSTANQITAYITDGGVITAELTHTLTNALNYNKIGLKYKLNDVGLWVNGTEVATDTSATMPSGFDELKFSRADGANDFYGKTKQLIVFDEALSDSELATLTS